MMWGSFGLAVSMMLISVLLSFTQARGYSKQLNYATSSASVTFFFTYVSSRPGTLDLPRKGLTTICRCSSSERQQTVFHGKVAGYIISHSKDLT